MTGASRAASPQSDLERRAARPGVATWLSLGAAPTFAFMALLSAPAAGPMSPICPAPPQSALSGMMVMYLLMGAFHLPPWLTLFLRRRGPEGAVTPAAVRSR